MLKHTTPSYNDVMKDLQYYILTENNIKKALSKKLITGIKPKQNITEPVLKANKNLFIPIEEDTLFWCFYILKNGDIKYETLHNKNNVIERQMKINYIDIIRKNKQIVKTYKFDTISNIESNLANDKFINIKTFLTLCAIENINILYINNKTYYELILNDDEVTILYSIDNKKKYNIKYGFEKNTDNKSNIVKSTLYKIDNIDKPIKSISSYTVPFLIDICKKLAIEITHKENGHYKSKKELYESICLFFQI
jgi:hypothetical protein